MINNQLIEFEFLCRTRLNLYIMIIAKPGLWTFQLVLNLFHGLLDFFFGVAGKDNNAVVEIVLIGV